MLKLNSTRPLFPFTEVTRAFELGSQALNKDKGGGEEEGSLLGEKSIFLGCGVLSLIRTKILSMSLSFYSSCVGVGSLNFRKFIPRRVTYLPSANLGHKGPNTVRIIPIRATQMRCSGMWDGPNPQVRSFCAFSIWY